jgi:hypothetical protein
MTEGANELTSKLGCGTGEVKYYTVNVDLLLLVFRTILKLKSPEIKR